MISNGHSHFSQWVAWQKLGIRTLKYAMCDMNDFNRFAEIQLITYFVDLTFKNFVTIFHINYYGHVIS